MRVSVRVCVYIYQFDTVDVVVRVRVLYKSWTLFLIVTFVTLLTICLYLTFSEDPPFLDCDVDL